MANRIVETKIILLLWLFSASVISHSTVSQALSLYSEAVAPDNSTHDRVNSTEAPDYPEAVFPSEVGGGEDESG